MVISFSHEIPYRFIVEHGYVATFRGRRRKQRNQDDWLNRGRGEKKEFDVHITEIGPVEYPRNSLLLERFAAASGFETHHWWLHAIEQVNDDVPDDGWLYLVTTVDDDE